STPRARGNGRRGRELHVFPVLAFPDARGQTMSSGSRSNVENVISRWPLVASSRWGGSRARCSRGRRGGRSRRPGCSRSDDVERLPIERRERDLEVAARGFEQASSQGGGLAALGVRMAGEEDARASPEARVNTSSGGYCSSVNS